MANNIWLVQAIFAQYAEKDAVDLDDAAMAIIIDFA